MAKVITAPAGRLESLDVLRGFDLFLLVGLEGVVHALIRAADGASWTTPLKFMFTHGDWEGLTPWDMVMPLFMFMAGVTIPFSRRHDGNPWKQAWRITRRVLMLWIFGMMCQGNLLAFDPSRIYVYSNTLQAIAVGYLIAVVLWITTSVRTQAIMAGVLLLVYWAGMWISVDGFGGGSYAPDSNFAEWVDRTVLGRWRDGAAMGPDGEPVFASWYTYTWVWSSLTFAVTVILGVLAGWTLRTGGSRAGRAMWLLLGGVALTLTGLLWGLEHPVVKRIWTPSMTLLSGGICWLLMAAFYYAIDCLGLRRGLDWVKVYGTNSIAAYMLMSCVNFSCVGASLFYGVERWIGPWYDVLIAVTSSLLIFGLLWLLRRCGIYLRV